MENNIAAKVKKLRKERKYSQEELAKEIGIHQTTISQIENGSREANRKHLIKYADFFNVNLDWLLGVEKKKRANN